MCGFQQRHATEDAHGFIKKTVDCSQLRGGVEVLDNNWLQSVCQMMSYFNNTFPLLGVTG